VTICPARAAVGALTFVAGMLGLHVLSYGQDDHPVAATLATVFPAVVWLVLFWMFGRSLAPGREPVVTAIARICHGSIDEAIVRYTRKVTVLWSAFFAGVSAGLGALAATLPPGQWPLIANLAMLPLAALVFAAEYFVRHRRFPDQERIPPIEMVRRLVRAPQRHSTAPEP
jgi:uncharacterized membrane protein